MAFKLNLSATYWTPVVVEVPADNGRFEKMTFDAEFKRLNRTDFQALVEKSGKRGKSDQDLIDEVLVNWKGIKDENNDDVSFNESNKAAVFEVIQVLPAMVRAYFDSMANVREKN